MKKAWMNISHFYFILFNLKIFGEIVTTFFLSSTTLRQYGVGLTPRHTSEEKKEVKSCRICKDTA